MEWFDNFTPPQSYMYVAPAAVIAARADQLAMF
jgi:hypothetical protein